MTWTHRRGGERARPIDWSNAEIKSVTDRKGFATGAGGAAGGWDGGHPGGRHGAECWAVALSTSTSREQLWSNVHGGLQLTTRHAIGP